MGHCAPSMALCLFFWGGSVDVSAEVTATEEGVRIPDPLPHRPFPVLLVPAAQEHLAQAEVVRDLLVATESEHYPMLSVEVSHHHTPVQEHVQRVVIAPSTLRGAVHAAQMINTWRPCLAPPVLLVLRVTDHRPPPTVAERFRALSGRVRQALELPHMHRLGMVYDPAEALSFPGRETRRMRRALEETRKMLYSTTFLAAGPAPSAEPVASPELVASSFVP